MSRENSPNYVLGMHDALSDMARVAEHGGVALGPVPPNPAYPWMYIKGYRENYAPSPHVCSKSCPFWPANMAESGSRGAR